MGFIRALFHKKADALKESGGKPVRLKFSDRDHILLPNGQHLRVERKDRSQPGKTLRRQRIKARRAARAAANT